MKNTRLKVQLGLDLGGHIDAVCSGPGACQGSSGFGQVGENVVGLALKRLDLNQEVFIIKLLLLFQECGTIRKNRFVVASVIIEPNQTSFQSLNKKRDQNLKNFWI